MTVEQLTHELNTLRLAHECRGQVLDATEQKVTHLVARNRELLRRCEATEAALAECEYLLREASDKLESARIIRGGQGKADEDVSDTGNATAAVVGVGVLLLATFLAIGV